MVQHHVLAAGMEPRPLWCEGTLLDDRVERIYASLRAHPRAGLGTGRGAQLGRLVIRAVCDAGLLTELGMLAGRSQADVRRVRSTSSLTSSPYVAVVQGS